MIGPACVSLILLACTSSHSDSGDGGADAPDTGLPDRVDGGNPPEDAGAGWWPDQPVVQLVDSDEDLVDLFVLEAGLLVVEEERVYLLGRDGEELASYASDRQIVSAALSEEYLAIGDRGALILLSPEDLTVLEMHFTTETCASIALFPAGRAVCSPVDRGGSLHAYDVLAGELTGSADPFSYSGFPVETIPGTTRFLAPGTRVSPSRWHLFELSSAGEPLYVSQSPFDGDILANEVYAFLGDPVTHIVDHRGNLLLIEGP